MGTIAIGGAGTEIRRCLLFTSRRSLNPNRDDAFSRKRCRLHAGSAGWGMTSSSTPVKDALTSTGGDPETRPREESTPIFPSADCSLKIIPLPSESNRDATLARINCMHHTGSRELRTICNACAFKPFSTRESMMSQISRGRNRGRGDQIQ